MFYALLFRTYIMYQVKDNTSVKATLMCFTLLLGVKFSLAGL